MGLTRPRAEQIYNLDYKQATRVVTVTDIALSGGAPAQVDGVTLATNDRILVAGQTTGSQNGIYDVVTVGTGSNGTWVRTSDANSTGEIEAGMIIMVTEGAVYHDTQWKLITDNPITIGVTALVFTQNYSANSISGGTSNVVVYSNANVTISSAGTPNVLIVSSTGTVTSGTASVTGTITVGNVLTGGEVSATGNVSGNYLLANIAYATGYTASRIYNGVSEVDIATVNGNANISIGGTPNVAVFATTGVYVSGEVSASGNVTGNNLIVNNIESVIGNITGGNILSTSNVSAVGAVIGSNLYTGGVVSATGNVRGNNLNTAGLVTAVGNVIGGNLNTAGNVTSGNILTGGLISATGDITGNNLLTGGQLSATGNVTGNNLLTGGQLSATGNVTGNYLLANIAYATGYTASKIYNGTSEVDIGTSNGNANISIGGTSNVVVIATTGEYVTGLISATGNVISGNISTSGELTAVGNITGGNLLINNNAVINGNLQVLGNVTFINSNVITTNDLVIELANNQSTYSAIDNAGIYVGNDGTGNPLTGWAYSYAANAWQTNIDVQSTGNIYAYGISSGQLVLSRSDVSAIGNVIAGNIIAYESLYGNGAGLSGINTFSNISITAGSSILANSIAETLTLTAGPGIAIVADAGNAAITISTASTGSSIFATGGDMGLVTDPVTASEDLGLIIDPYSIAYDLGGVIDASGLIYPSQLVLPTYTPGTLPSAVPAAQFVFLSTSSIGAMTAFSDGSNWRFTSSGNVVS